MNKLFITLFVLVSASIAPSCLASGGGWASGSLGHGGSWGNGGADLGGGAGWTSGASGWGGAALGGSGWSGSGCGSSGPQVVSATWGAHLPGPSVRLLPAMHSQLVKVVAAPLAGHSCGCC